MLFGKKCVQENIEEGCKFYRPNETYFRVGTGGELADFPSELCEPVPPKTFRNRCPAKMVKRVES